MELADAAVEAGAETVAREWMAAVATNLAVHATLPSHLQAPLLGRLAVRWGMLGAADRLTECIATIEPMVHQLQAIEQPAIWALLGEAWTRLGEPDQAFVYYERAVESAGQLINPRPRAIACVEICLSLNRAGWRDARTDAGLNRVLASFGATNG